MISTQITSRNYNSSAGRGIVSLAQGTQLQAPADISSISVASPPMAEVGGQTARHNFGKNMAIGGAAGTIIFGIATACGAHGVGAFLFGGSLGLTGLGLGIMAANPSQGGGSPAPAPPYQPAPPPVYTPPPAPTPAPPKTTTHNGLQPLRLANSNATGGDLEPLINQLCNKGYTFYGRSPAGTTADFMTNLQNGEPAAVALPGSPAKHAWDLETPDKVEQFVYAETNTRDKLDDHFREGLELLDKVHAGNGFFYGRQDSKSAVSCVVAPLWLYEQGKLWASVGKDGDRFHVDDLAQFAQNPVGYAESKVQN